MDREYFSIKLSTGIDLALSLTDMKVATQFEVTNICIVPGVADFWYGVTNFKGSLVWVLDSDRFFNIAKTASSSQKLTSVIFHQQQAQKVAIVTRQLQGIISIQPDRLKPIENDTSILSKCCSAVVETEALSTYIIEPTALFSELHERSLTNAKSLIKKTTPHPIGGDEGQRGRDCELSSDISAVRAAENPTRVSCPPPI